jgi:molybdenum cofactor cytidylyltransferase
MKFGDIPLDQAEGAILAHRLRKGTLAFTKGRQLSADDVAALRAEGVASVVAAKLDPGDILEDPAAARVAAVVGGDGVTVAEAATGRSNLYAAAQGVLVYDAKRLDALNLVHEAVTIAALPPFDVVAPKRMVATVKIIPYAAPESAVAEVERLAREGDGPLFRVAPFVGKKVALIQTELPSVKASVLEKTVRVIEGRIQHIAGTLLGERRCAHETAAIAKAVAEAKAEGADMILVVGASAITDRRDVIPEAVERAGGRVLHLGMPVDPGNLLMLGELDGKTPVLGMPGCVRSPKLNGADWVMERLGAGLAVTADDIKRMGAGGLLMEIGTRPMPREKTGS